MSDFSRVEAITFDFFNTLIHHREGRGRGRLLIEYLQTHGLGPVPWEHDVLYDVFESHDVEYSPEARQEQKEAYYAVLAQRVFERLEVPTSEGCFMSATPLLTITSEERPRVSLSFYWIGNWDLSRVPRDESRDSTSYPEC